MPYILGWFVVLMLLVLWSLAAWAVHAVAIWTVSNAGAVSGAVHGLGTLSLPAWIEPWLPAEIAASLTVLLSGLGPFINRVLQAVPALADGLTLATLTVWGAGSALLVLIGASLHLLISRWRRRGSESRGPGALAVG